MRTLRFLALTIVGILGLAAAAEAACLATDLNNTQWFAYATWSGGWTRCSLNIGANGAVTGGSCSAYDEIDGTGTESVTGGSFAISTACVVTGQFTTSVSGSHRVMHAALDRGKTVLVGVGKDVSGGDAWQFSAVKR